MAKTTKADATANQEQKKPQVQKKAVVGYRGSSVGDGGVKMPVDIVIFCSNKADGLTVKHSAKTITEKEAEKFVKGIIFYHISHMFQKRKYDDKKKEDRYKSTYYRNRSNTISVKEYGVKMFTGTVDEWQERQVETSTIMVVQALAEIKVKNETKFYRTAIFLTASGRSAAMESLEDACIFKLNSRKATAKEQEEKKWGKHVYYPQMIEGVEGKDYTAVNENADEMARLMKIYFEEKGLIEKAKPVETTKAVVETAPPQPAPANDGAAADGSDDDLPF